jgi:hypothetical protein
LRVPPREKVKILHCKDCPRWYGAEDEELGPCSIKHVRGDKKYLTHGTHECDEPEQIKWFKTQKPTRKKKKLS